MLLDAHAYTRKREKTLSLPLPTLHIYIDPYEQKIY